MSETQTTVDARTFHESPPPDAAPLARIPEVLPARTYVEAPETIATAALRAEVISFTCSPEIDQLAGGLAAAQLAFGKVIKTHRANVESRREGARSYSYDYAPLSEVLDAVMPALNQNGIALLQPPLLGKTSGVITTLLMHVSGQWFRNDFRLPVENFDPQAIGSVITYLRRYTIQSILGVAPEHDDDGAAAMPRKNGNGNGHKPASVPMPERASVQQPPPPPPAPPPPATGFLLTACVKKTPPNHTVYWAATWRGKDVVAFDEVGQALEQAFRANRPIKELRTHEKHASVGNKVFIHVDEIVFAGGGQ